MSREPTGPLRTETLAVHRGVYKDAAYNSVTTPSTLKT